MKDSISSALKAAAKMSKVSNAKNNKLTKPILYLVILAVAFFTILLIFTGKHGGKNSHVTLQSSIVSDNYEASLEKNLSELGQKISHTKAEIEQTASEAHSFSMSKEFLARESAPTRMYSASVHVDHNPYISAQGEKLFAGRSTAVGFTNQTSNVSHVSVELSENH